MRVLQAVQRVGRVLARGDMRFAELASALYGMGLGFLFLSIAPVFASPQYTALAQLQPQGFWGWYALIAGVVTLIGVASDNTTVRFMGACSLTFIYTLIFVSFYLNHIYLPGLVSHFMFACFGSLASVRLALRRGIRGD